LLLSVKTKKSTAARWRKATANLTAVRLCAMRN
jgi:hypothetical protein